MGRTGSGDFALARYNDTDRSLDMSFSGDGKETTDLGGWDHGRAVAIQNGKIVVAGTSLHGADGNFALARYNPDGSLDTSFSGDGMQTSDFGVRHDAHAVALQADGKVVVAGTSESDDGNFALARYDDDGTLDPSFSGDGWQTTNFGDRDYGHSMALGADGRIVVAGESAVDFALARYNSDGTLDSSFSGDGKATTDFDVRGLDRAFDVALQPDGKIVAAGTRDGTFALRAARAGRPRARHRRTRARPRSRVALPRVKRWRSTPAPGRAASRYSAPTSGDAATRREPTALTSRPRQPRPTR